MSQRNMPARAMTVSQPKKPAVSGRASTLPAWLAKWVPGEGLPTEATAEVLAQLIPAIRAANRPVGTVTIEMGRAMARLIEQFPDVSERRGAALREGYRDVLVAYPEDVAVAALDEARLSCMFVPVPAELRRIAAGLMAPRVQAEAHAGAMAVWRRQEGPPRAAVSPEERERALRLVERSTARLRASARTFGGTAMDDRLDRPIDGPGTAEAVRNGLIGAATFRLPPEDHPAVRAYLREMERDHAEQTPPR